MSLTENIRVINHSSAILHYLNQLQELKVPVKIRFSESGEESIFDSVIRNIDPDKGRIVLQQYYTEEWEHGNKAPSEVKVTCQLNQGNFTFDSVISPLESSDELINCCLRIPEQLQKVQHRSAFRVSLFNYETVFAFTDEQGKKANGYCEDFSSAGCLCLVHVDHKNEAQKTLLAKGNRIDSCEFSIFGILSFTCPAIVRHIKKIDDVSVQIGLEFVDLPDATADKISKAMIRLERQHINTHNQH